MRRRSARVSFRAVDVPGGVSCRQWQPETLDYRMFFLDGSGKKVSPWHDVPLDLGDDPFNFIVEIPKNTSAKMEVATDEPFTPIKQDTKKGKPRYYPGITLGCVHVKDAAAAAQMLLLEMPNAEWC